MANPRPRISRAFVAILVIVLVVTLHRFVPATETFDTFALPARPSNVRQILGRPGEIWGAQSANDSLIVIRAAG